MSNNAYPEIDARPPRNGDRLSESKRRLLEQRMRGLGVARRPDDRIQPRLAGTRIPISAEQYRIWIHASTHPGLPLYNEPITIHRRGDFNLQVFEESFNHILCRHEAWRTSFALEGQSLVQIVAPTLRVHFPLTDLTSFPPEKRDAEALRLATEDARTPIPLDSAPLFRARVFRLADDDHRLHLTLHHIIFDGVSIYHILLPELAAIYAALAEGRPIPLAPPILQYGDYALWRQRQVASPEVRRHIDYWKQHLAGELPVLRLPGDRPRPPQMSQRGSMEVFALPTDLVDRLRAVGKANGATLYMTLLASFKALLFRYSGQEDLIVGGAADARRRPELAGLMGYFLDTFAMRTRPAAAKPFTEYLAEVKHAVLGALSAADVPFNQVVQALQPRRDSSYHPIFQVFFSIEPPSPAFAGGWDLTQMDVTVGSAKFDLYLELDERPDGMAARIMYNTDIFDAPTIRRMADHWTVLLEAVSHAPESTLGTLPILTPREIAQLTGPGGWNDTNRPIPDATLHSLFEAQAARTPEATAIVFGSKHLSYRDLNLRTEALAGRLREACAAAGQDLGPGTIVAIYLNRSLDLLPALLAVLKTGAAYLPLDPESPPARLALSLEDACPVAILTEIALASNLPKAQSSILLVDRHQPAQWMKLRGRSVPVPSQSAPSDLAYVIHTSGTTGRPKAVEITHRSLVNLLASMQGEPGFSPRDILLAVTTVSFDIAALELFLPLVSGGQVVVASREAAQDPFLLAALIESSGCTVMQATPATWRALLGSGWRGRGFVERRTPDAAIEESRSPERRTRAHSHPPLRVLCGGEALPRELAERLLSAGAVLWNMYGPTETTIWSTVHRVVHGEGPVPIGRPIANTSAFILDSERNLLPVGVPGDLFLGGAGLARGYRGNPDATANRFTSIEAVGGARLYRTGDLAVRRADGLIECLGRTDNQVKVRGFRVELEAVEAAVLRHPNVASAAARVWPERGGGMRLAVYLVPQAGAAPDRATLRSFLQADLPDYMIPSDLVPLDRIPLTPNGKIDRAALPPVSHAEHDHPALLPSTAFERALASLWTELLGVDTVGLRDDFFNLGGHSLLVAALQHRVAETFGFPLSMAALFHAPTVGQQALLLEAAARGESASPGLIGRPVPDGSNGDRPAIFWLHPSRDLHHLAEALGDDLPLLGVALTQADLDLLPPAPDMQSIAARHVRTILHAQPNGPYIVGGLCTGGIVAFETAAQLRASGHEVSLVVLLDAQNPAFYKRTHSIRVELNRIIFYLRQALSREEAHGGVTLRQRISSRIRRSLVLPDTEMKAVIRTADLAAYAYTPSAYSGNVLLLQPKDRPTELDFVSGWKAVVPDSLAAFDVEGHHDELFQPENAQDVARAITAHLAASAPETGQQGMELVG